MTIVHVSPAAAVPPSVTVAVVNVTSCCGVVPVVFAVWIRVTIAAAFASWLIPFAVRPVRLKPSVSWILSVPGVVVQSTV